MTFADHRRMVADQRRITTYAAAIQACVRPGDVVVDLGTGTGLLAVLAARAGAKRVFAVERSSMHTVAQAVARANGVSQVITVLHGDSRQVQVPEPADWLVSELLGTFGLEENALALLADARHRWLKADGQLIPRHLTLAAAPAEAPRTSEGMAFWERHVLDLDLSPVARAARQDLQRADPADIRLLAAGQTWQSLPLGQAAIPHLQGSLTFVAAEAGICHGFAGWFDAELAPDIYLSDHPESPATHWGTAFLPVETPFQVDPGDTIRLDLQAVSVAGTVAWNWQWHWTCAAGEARGSGGQSEVWEEIWLATRDELNGPIARTAEGDATAAVLDLCNRGLGSEDMARALQAQGGPFADPAVARRWVRKVVKRYGRPEIL